jgi:glycosyltransferase involved in cell wall biosynthesis
MLKYKYNIKLSLVGSFDNKNKKILENKIKTMNMKNDVKILGKVNYEKLPELYNKHDIKIYASKSETFGMTMLEAMKCGLPILATKNQISYEVLSSAGFFCKETENDIRDGIVKMLKDEKNIKSKVRKGKKISNKFKWNTTSKKTFNFLENIGG